MGENQVFKIQITGRVSKMKEDNIRMESETIEEEYARYKRYWDKFMNTGEIDPGLNPVIAKSWIKCRNAGTSIYSGKGKLMEDSVFQSIWDANRDLIDTAMPVMKSVYEIINESKFFFVLTDSVGYVLETLGISLTEEMQNELNFRKKALWSDVQVGSNAIGIALDYDTPVQTMGAEHYCVVQHGWTCSAAPIHGINGEIIGCLDLSCADYHKKNPHTLGLVVAGAFSIETMLNHSHVTRMLQETLDGSLESTLLLDQNFRVLLVNQALREFFHLDKEKEQEIIGTDFRDAVPDLNWSEVRLQAQNGGMSAHNVRIVFRENEYHCGINITSFQDRTRNYTVSIRNQKKMIADANHYMGNRAQYTFDSILARDPEMLKTISLAKKYAKYDGIVLIQGESGTGKELFAQSIHNESLRANGPFVAVNCASIPRDLIESELFGYEKGAFTGALNEGNPGKFELANHGTLFLDEIGEMPLEFQAKLLRAVETLRIRRIGGKKEIPLDIRIIAATNRDLQKEAEKGRFRQDLYYRLNVLSLSVPPLRERREDIIYDAENFLERYNRKYPDQKKTMSAGFQLELMQYNWPGNVRELQNGIERTFYAVSGNTLEASDFQYISAREPASARGEAELQAEQNERAQQIKQSAEPYRQALLEADFDTEKAAEILDMSRATFYRRCRKYGISPRSLAKEYNRARIRQEE